MPNTSPASGYLSEVEASHLLTQAIPGAIVVHLKREMDAESGGQPGAHPGAQPGGGRQARRMFIELTVSEAVQHWRHMGELIRKAGAMEVQPPHADAAGNL